MPVNDLEYFYKKDYPPNAAKACNMCGANFAEVKPANGLCVMIEVVRDQFICEDCYRLMEPAI